MEGRCSKLDFLENEWFNIDGFSLAMSLSVKERDRLLLDFFLGTDFSPADDDRFIGFTLEMPKRIYKYSEVWVIGHCYRGLTTLDTEKSRKTSDKEIKGSAYLPMPA